MVVAVTLVDTVVVSVRVVCEVLELVMLVLVADRVVETVLVPVCEVEDVLRLVVIVSV